MEACLGQEDRAEALVATAEHPGRHSGILGLQLHAEVDALSRLHAVHRQALAAETRAEAAAQGAIVGPGQRAVVLQDDLNDLTRPFQSHSNAIQKQLPIKVHSCQAPKGKCPTPCPRRRSHQSVPVLPGRSPEDSKERSRNRASPPCAWAGRARASSVRLTSKLRRARPDTFLWPKRLKTSCLPSFLVPKTLVYAPNATKKLATKKLPPVLADGTHHGETRDLGLRQHPVHEGEVAHIELASKRCSHFSNRRCGPHLGHQHLQIVGSSMFVDLFWCFSLLFVFHPKPPQSRAWKGSSPPTWL